MNRVVVISGVGIGVESGLATFRGADGLWRGDRQGMQHVSARAAIPRARRAHVCRVRPGAGTRVSH